jgi:hypothetical protein
MATGARSGVGGDRLPARQEHVPVIGSALLLAAAPALATNRNRLLGRITSLGHRLVTFQAIGILNRNGQFGRLDGGTRVPGQRIVRSQPFRPYAPCNSRPGVTIDAARSTAWASVERWKKVDSGWVWQDAQKESWVSWVAAKAKPLAARTIPSTTSPISTQTNLGIPFFGDGCSTVIDIFLISDEVRSVAAATRSQKVVERPAPSCKNAAWRALRLCN